MASSRREHEHECVTSGGAAAAPQIISGNCSVTLNGSSSSASRSAAPGSDIYDKQMAWKLHGQRKIQSKSHELTSLEAHECTFAPKTNRSKRRSLPDSPTTTAKDERVAAADMASPSSSPSPLRFRSSERQAFSSMEDAATAGSSSAARASAEASAAAGAASDAPPIHPTAAQESSIQLHLVRQTRAREFAQDAQHKLFASAAASQRAKDFSRVTAFEPFKLSVGNQKQRANSASPTKTRHESALVVPSGSSQQSPPHETAPAAAGERGRSFKKAPRAQWTTAASHQQQQQQSSSSGNGQAHHQQQHESREESWDKERAGLLAMLDAQRRELEQREKAQQDALHVAESFASAIQSFEARLVAVESSTAQELASIRELLERQTAATELILQSLGLAQLLPPSSPSPSSATAALRRETK